MKTAQNNTYDMNRVNLWEVAPLDTPFLFCIEPTFLCNIRCNYCMHAASKEEIERQGFRFDSMTWENFQRILLQLTEFPKKIKKITFGGFGEPLVDKRLTEMVHQVKDKNVVDKTLVISNGLLLTEELWDSLRDAGLDEIKISLNGLSAKKYKNICGVNIDYDKFYNILTYIYKNKGNCKIRIKVADTALDAGEDKIFYDKFSQICDYIAIEHIYNQFNLVDYNGKLKDDKKNRFGYDFKRVNICSCLFFKLSVLQDGRITFGFPDGIYYDNFNIKETTLYNVWNSPERKKFLIDQLTGNRPNECETCTRWAYSVVPEDLLDGHEQKILSRMPQTEINIENLKKPVILCRNNNC